MYLKKGEEAIGRCHKFILSAGRVVWQLETWLDAEMRSVTFFDCHTGWDGWILEHIPGSWDIHVVKCWSLWSNLTCRLWVAGFCQPCRCCTGCLQMQLVWYHLQDPAYVLIQPAIVSCGTDGHSHILSVLIELFSHMLMCRWLGV